MRRTTTLSPCPFRERGDVVQLLSQVASELPHSHAHSQINSALHVPDLEALNLYMQDCLGQLLSSPEHVPAKEVYQM